MKKLIAISIIFLILVDCGATKELNGIPGKKTLKGEWQVDEIEFFGAQGTYKAFMFDIADSHCFKNSVWMFIPNNYTGKFNLTSNWSDCEPTTANIRWSYYDSNQERSIQFKYIDNKNKSIDPDNRGYRMIIKTLNQTKMKIELELEQQGSPFSIVMTMTKISDNIFL